MFLDGSTGRFTHWIVLHCPSMCELKNVLWVDTDRATYCLAQPRKGAAEPVSRVVQARKILVIAAGCLVLIDPIQDPFTEPTTSESFSETSLADQA